MTGPTAAPSPQDGAPSPARPSLLVHLAAAAAATRAFEEDAAQPSRWVDVASRWRIAGREEAMAVRMLVYRR